MTEKNTNTCCAKKGMVGVIILLIAMGLFLMWHHQKAETKFPVTHYGTWLDVPKLITPFTLESTLGGNFTEANFKGHWSWVFFGFTSCPDMCPHTMQAFKMAVDTLKKDKITTLPQVILVSLDPKRDTIPVLQKYVTAFNPSFVGLVGSMDQVSLLANQMSVSYQDLGEGKMQHSGTVTVVNPKGKIQAFFPWIDEPEKMARDYEAMLKQ